MGAVVRVRSWWRAFRHSILFFPTLLTLAAIGAFAATSMLDIRFVDWFAQVAFQGQLWGFLVFAGSTDSAGRVLSTITGTWATIVGVVYSVTLVTIQLSATKYSAQVIPVFEEDRLNQVTLGTFTATFAYALLVLKTVRGGDAPFVPVIGVNVAIILALLSLGLLIAFIGNLTAYIRPTRFVQDYAKKGHDNMPRLVEPAGLPGYEPARDPTHERDGGVAVGTEGEGYVAKIEWNHLRKVAGNLRGVERVDVLVSLGAYATKETTLARVHGDVDEDEARRRVAACFQLGKAPDASDPDRVVETLADIGVTALSGGATDVGVATVALRSLLDVTATGLRQEDPGPLFAVARRDKGDDRHVLIGRRREAFHRKGYREARRILTKAGHEGYWDVGEIYAREVGYVLRSAADTDDRQTWDETLEWFGECAETILRLGDAPSRRRTLEHLRQGIHDLREQGHQEQALDVEFALMEAARRVGDENATADARRATRPHERGSARDAAG